LETQLAVNRKYSFDTATTLYMYKNTKNIPFLIILRFICIFISYKIESNTIYYAEN